MGDYVLLVETADPDLQKFITGRLEDEGITVSVCDHPESPSKCAFIVQVPDDIIRREAESWSILKREENGLKREYEAVDHEKFATPYTTIKESDELFSPSEVSYITHEILKRVKIKEVVDCFPRVKSGILPSDSMLLALERAEMLECWPLHAGGKERKSAWDVGPLKSSFCDFMEHYFGSNVALYFAWLKNYIIWLIIPAIAGFLVFLYHYLNPDINIDNSHVSPIYTCFIIIWSVLFVKGWDRKRAAHVCDWGINTVRWRREVRPEYQGRKRISPITGLSERYFADQERIFRYCVSASVTFFMLFLAFSIMVLSLNLQGYIHPYSYSKNYLLFPSISWLCDEGEYFDPSGKGPIPTLLLYIPVILHVAIIQILNKIYQQVAIRLTAWENHRSPVHHENALFIKRFFFEAFDCYIALFYLAFIEKDIVLLRRELVSLYTVDSLRRLSTETLIPFVTRQATRKISKHDQKLKVDERLSKDYDKIEYEQFDDYLEMVIQIGYVTLFAGAFPLAAPLSLICNVLEMYSDVFKLSNVMRRPVVHRVTNIGVWSILVKGIVLMSVFTNLYIFCFTSEQLLHYAPSLFVITPIADEAALKFGSDHVHNIAPDAGMTVTTIMTSLEHLILLIVAVIWVLVQDVPSSVQDELARRDYVKFLKAHGNIRHSGISALSVDETKPVLEH